MNNKKSHTHKGRICLIDGSEIYTPKRAQNELSLNNIQTLYDLYNNYTDVIERCKIVTLKDVEDGGFDLSVKRYIERKKQETIPPAVVRQNYFAALEAVRAAETKMRKLLIEGGYVHE